MASKDTHFSKSHGPNSKKGTTDSRGNPTTRVTGIPGYKDAGTPAYIKEAATRAARLADGKSFDHSGTQQITGTHRLGLDHYATGAPPRRKEADAKRVEPDGRKNFKQTPFHAS